MKLIVTDRLGTTTDLSTGRSVPALHNSSNTYPRGSVGLSISGLTISSATGFMLNPAPAPVPIDDNPYRWIILLSDSDHEWTQAETDKYNDYLSALSSDDTAYAWASTMLSLSGHTWSTEETEAYNTYITSLFPDGLPAYDTIDFDELFDPDHVWTEQEEILISHYDYFGV